MIPPPPTPTWAPSRRARSTPCPVHVGSVGTKGGPRVDAHGRVLHVRDRPIPGLYGAGNVIASPAGPAYYGGGTSIGMGMVWGHLAGTHAASFATAGAARTGMSRTAGGGAAARRGPGARMYELMVLILRVRRTASGGG